MSDLLELFDRADGDLVRTVAIYAGTDTPSGSELELDQLLHPGPPGMCRVLAAYAWELDDRVSREDMIMLVPFVPRLATSAAGPDLTRRRALLIADRTMRSLLPAALVGACSPEHLAKLAALPPIVSASAANAAYELGVADDGSARAVAPLATGVRALFEATSDRHRDDALDTIARASAQCLSEVSEAATRGIKIRQPRPKHMKGVYKAATNLLGEAITLD
jgi:hypothetical protein